MSAPEGVGHSGAGRGQRPSAASAALPAGSVGSASSRAGGGAARLAAVAPTPGAAEQTPASSPPAAAPGAAGAPCAGLAALSLHTPGPGNGAVAGRGALATQPTGASTVASTSSPVAGASATPDDGAVARGGGVPGQGPAASPTPTGGVPTPDLGLPVPVGDDGLPLSAEAAASPFSPPATQRHAAFLKLVDSSIKAGLHMRHMRCADCSELAAEAGVPLFGGNSIIVATLWARQALSLYNQSVAESDTAEEEALQRRSWAALFARALPVLQSRLDTGTLLPGKLRKAEEAYEVYVLQAICRVTEQPALGVATLQRLSRLMGYRAALYAAATLLFRLLPLPLWRSDERGRMQVFVLAALRLIPKTAGLLDTMEGELVLVNEIERYMTPSVHDADFCASVLALWRSRAVVDVLRSRGMLQRATSTLEASNAEFDSRQKADVAKRGLRRCELPSCGKQETTVLQFRVCGHCQTTRYCCPEHAKQHWKVHKREYEAEMEEWGEAGEAGAGAAA